MTITSISNEKVQFFRNLSDTSFRKRNECFLAEGANLVKDIPQTADVLRVYVKESKQEEFADILNKFTAETVVLSDELFDRVSSTVTPIGIAAVVKNKRNTDISDISADKVIVLDHVSDAGNVGAILRTAVAAGYEEAVFIDSADPFSPKAVRASMSAIFKIRCIFCDTNAFLCSKNLKLYDIIILDMLGEDIFEYKAAGKYALVVGNEAHGVSSELKGIGKPLSIPMHFMESLNAAVSAGIAMYVLGRK